MNYFDTTKYGQRIHNHFQDLGDVTQKGHKRHFGRGSPALRLCHINTMSCLMIAEEFSKSLEKGETIRLNMGSLKAALPAIVHHYPSTGKLAMTKAHQLKKLGLIDVRPDNRVTITDLGQSILNDYLHEFRGLRNGPYYSSIRQYIFASEREMFIYHEELGNPHPDTHTFLKQRLRWTMFSTLHSLIEQSEGLSGSVFYQLTGMLDMSLWVMFDYASPVFSSKLCDFIATAPESN